MKRQIDIMSQSYRQSRHTIRPGFTLTELIVVILIILIITVGALPAVLGGLRDRKYSEAVRTVQAALAGARDRAITSGQVRGIRLVRDGEFVTDPTDTSIFEVSRLVYVGVTEPYAVGTVNNVQGMLPPNVIRVDANEDTNSNGIMDPGEDVNGNGMLDIGSVLNPAWERVDPGKDNTTATADDIPRVDAPRQSNLANDVRTFESYIRFNQSGPLYQIVAIDDVTGFGGRSTLVLNTSPPFAGSLPPPPVVPFRSTYQLFGPALPVASDQPVLLPEGIVIDVRTPTLAVPSPPGSRPDLEILRMPRSANIPNQDPRLAYATFGDLQYGTGDDLRKIPATWPHMDILFAPNGTLTGRAAQTDIIHLWVGERSDRADLGPDNTGATADDLPTVRPHKMVSLVVRSGAIIVTDNPPSVGVAPQYSAIYGPPAQSVGVSQLQLP